MTMKKHSDRSETTKESTLTAVKDKKSDGKHQDKTEDSSTAQNTDDTDKTGKTNTVSKKIKKILLKCRRNNALCEELCRDGSYNAVEVYIVRIGKQIHQKEIDKAVKHKSALFNIKQYDSIIEIEKQGSKNIDCEKEKSPIDVSGKEVSSTVASGQKDTSTDAGEQDVFDDELKQYKIEDIKKALNAIKGEKGENNIYIAVTDYALDDRKLGGCLEDGTSDKEQLFFLNFREAAVYLNEMYLDVVNYILSAVYRDVTRYLFHEKSLMHDATRGCIFDRCCEDDIQGVIFYTAKPQLCNTDKIKVLKGSKLEDLNDGCENKLKTLEKDTGFDKTAYVDLLKAELKRLKKPAIYKFNKKVERKPATVLIFNLLISIIGLIFSIVSVALSC